MRWRAEAALVLNTFIWGATFVVVKEALEDVSATLFLALRFTLASAVLMLLFRRSWSNPRLARQALRGGLMAGVFLFSAYLLQTIGLHYTTAAKSAFITGLTTAMAPLLAWFVYRNRPGIGEAAGVLLCTVGMGLMTLDGSSWSVARGDLLTFFCAIGFAAHILVLGHYSKKTSWEVMSVAQIGVSAVLAWAMFSWVERPYLRWSPRVLFAVAVTGLLATALAFSLMAWAQRYTTPTRTALILTLEPVFAWITSWIVAGETLSGRAAGGAALILGGVLCVELKPFRVREHPSS